MSEPGPDDLTVRLVEERLRVGRREVETGRVHIKTVVEEHQQWVHDRVSREEVSVEHVPVDRFVDAVPEVRQEGDELVIPIVEEVLVVEKRLRLREELRVRKVRHVEDVSTPVTLRSTRADIERT